MTCPSLYNQIIKTGTKPYSHVSIFISDSLTPASLFSFHIPTAECITCVPQRTELIKIGATVNFQFELLPVQANLGAFCSWSWAATLKYVEIGFAGHFQLHHSAWFCDVFKNRVN